MMYCTVVSACCAHFYLLKSNCFMQHHYEDCSSLMCYLGKYEQVCCLAATTAVDMSTTDKYDMGTT